jgi:hypothetical protein
VEARSWILGNRRRSVFDQYVVWYGLSAIYLIKNRSFVAGRLQPDEVSRLGLVGLVCTEKEID